MSFLLLVFLGGSGGSFSQLLPLTLCSCPQTPAPSRTASFSESRSDEVAPAKKAKPAMPPGTSIVSLYSPLPLFSAGPVGSAKDGQGGEGPGTGAPAHSPSTLSQYLSHVEIQTPDPLLEHPSPSPLVPANLNSLASGSSKMGRPTQLPARLLESVP